MDFGEEVHAELLHLAALVRAGALPKLELQNVLLSLVQADVPNMPSMERLLEAQQGDDADAAAAATAAERTEAAIAAADEAEERAWQQAMKSATERGEE